jgi:type VI secretion system protein ImpE
MTPSELYQSGRLTEAIEAATAEVKKHPADTQRRGILCEMLCFGGDFERADKQLEAISLQDPKAAVGVALYRQLIRAETARQQFFAEGRLPEFIDKPSPVLELHLEASICIRAGDAAKAAELLGRTEEQRGKVGGVCDGKPFDDIRDLDDLTASFFEVLTSTGKYYWIGMEQVQVIEFRAPEHPHDLIWRRALMVVNNGPDGEVYLPALYAGTHTNSDDQLRLGRATDWVEAEGEPVRGVGQRTFLIGDEDKTIMECGLIKFGDSADE